MVTTFSAKKKKEIIQSNINLLCKFLYLFGLHDDYSTINRIVTAFYVVVGIAVISFDALLSVLTDNVPEIISTYSSDPVLLGRVYRQGIGSIESRLSSNVACPKDILSELSNCANSGVKFNVVKNPNTPRHIIEEIMRGGETFLIARCCSKIAIDKDLLMEIIDENDNDLVICGVSTNPNVDDDIAEAILQKSDSYKAAENLFYNEAVSDRVRAIISIKHGIVEEGEMES
jgi:hypothetical protein